MFQTVQNIEKTLLENNEILKNLGVSKLFLFGSVAKGQNTQISDLDFVVQFQAGKKSFDNFMDLSFTLEELFYTKIDLITEDSLKGNMKKIIMSEVIPFEIRY